MYQSEEPSEILPNIFLGSAFHSKNGKLLQKLGITHILNVAEEVELNDGNGFKVHHVKLHDTLEETVHFETIFEFIDSMEPHEKILIHCMAGISRSSTVVIGYLMRNNKWDTKTALTFVTSKRAVVSPNKGFILQLLMYEKKLLGSVVIDSVLTKELAEDFKYAMDSFCRMIPYIRDKSIIEASYIGKMKRMDQLLQLVSSDSPIVLELSNSKKKLNEAITKLKF